MALLQPKYLYKTLLFTCLALLAQGCASTAETSFALGDEKELAGLYSYPNTPDSTETLANTIEHYIKQTLTRDGFNDAQVKVAKQGQQYTVTLQGDSAQIVDYNQRYPGFLTYGKLAYLGSQKLQKTPLWQKDWRFFLPLGLAMDNQRSVQLLHFPPDYSLPAQDYLGSSTSQRWEDLLTLNGVSPKQVTLYETIIDIAPIAAPAGDGKKLEGVYSYFSDYAHNMLGYMARPKAGSLTARAVVAYGSPVRTWIEQQYQVKIGVLGTGYLKLDSQNKAPVLGANHPSYFWYAAEQSCDDGWTVMREDLIAARWQMQMPEAVHTSAAQVLNQATSYWDTRHPEICQQVRVQSSDCTTKVMKNCPVN